MPSSSSPSTSLPPTASSPSSAPDSALAAASASSTALDSSATTMLNRNPRGKPVQDEIELLEEGEALLPDEQEKGKEKRELLEGEAGTLTLRDKKALTLLIALCTLISLNPLHTTLLTRRVSSSSRSPCCSFDGLLLAYTISRQLPLFCTFPLLLPVRPHARNSPSRPPPRHPRRPRLRIHPLPPARQTLLLANRHLLSLHLSLLAQAPLVPHRRFHFQPEAWTAEELDRTHSVDCGRAVVVARRECAEADGGGESGLECCFDRLETKRSVFGADSCPPSLASIHPLTFCTQTGRTGRANSHFPLLHPRLLRRYAGHRR
jgi:hypothetical protein